MWICPEERRAWGVGDSEMDLYARVCDQVVVLEFGRKIAEGLPAEIRDNPAVVAAYLGVDESDAS